MTPTSSSSGGPGPVIVAPVGPGQALAPLPGPNAAGVGPGPGEDLYTLEAEITELQRENARVESQVLRLRSDITAMENQLKHGDKVRIVSLVPAAAENSVGTVRIPCVDVCPRAISLVYAI